MKDYYSSQSMSFLSFLTPFFSLLDCFVHLLSVCPLLFYCFFTFFHFFSFLFRFLLFVKTFLAGVYTQCYWSWLYFLHVSMFLCITLLYLCKFLVVLDEKKSQKSIRIHPLGTRKIYIQFCPNPYMLSYFTQN